MDIQTFRARMRMSQQVFAALLTKAGSPCTQSLVSQWENGLVKVPAERWGVIAHVTGGAVTSRDLRPDIYGPAVPESAKPQQAVAHG